MDFFPFCLLALDAGFCAPRLFKSGLVSLKYALAARKIGGAK
jgi:hypothetical protein